ncbi:hypothetical protein TcCL_ESM08166 [Trypanosoma cruzi]|nr:hypothetical protein TcCL_ESM08166 [Trypanosoma cruzi]
MRDAPRWHSDSSQAKHQPVASSMPLHGISVLVPTETEGLRRSAPTPRCVVSSNKTTVDGRVHHRGSCPQMWKRHRTRRKKVRMMSLHVSRAACQVKENLLKRKSAHSPPPQAVLSGRSNHEVGGSTLFEGYCDHLTRPRACPHNVLLPYLPLHAPASSLKPHPGQIR